MMNAYLSRQEKPNFVRLSVILGLAAEIANDYAKANNPDKEFMKSLRTCLTWGRKALERRKEFLDKDAALDFARQCSRLEPIIFVPSDKAKKEYEDIQKMQGMIAMSHADLEDWFSMVIPFTCEKCDGKCMNECNLRIILAKYGIFPMQPEAKGFCQYSYFGKVDFEQKTIIEPKEYKDPINLFSR